MSTLDVSLTAARLSVSLVEDIAQLFKPLSRRAAEEALEARKSAGDLEPSEDPGGWGEHYQGIVDADGRVEIKVERLTERNGVVHSEGVNLDRLSESQSARVKVQTEGTYPASWAYVDGNDWSVSVHLDVPSDDIVAMGDAVKKILGQNVDPERLAAQTPPFKVFVGHGGDVQWKYLRQMLQTHGYVVEAFESSERAGFLTLSVVETMVRSSTVALVVMTGEDRMEDGSLRARENVVHEVGFCQGALGLSQTIVLMEEGVSEPTNIAGLTQIRFPRGALIEKEDSILEALEQRRRAHSYVAI